MACAPLCHAAWKRGIVGGALAQARPLVRDLLGTTVEVLDAALTDPRRLAELKARRRVVRGCC